MTSFNHVMIPTWGKWFKQTLTMNRTIMLIFHLCFTNGKDIPLQQEFDRLSLYCGSVKLKFKRGSRYWFLWESCELQFPKFTDKFGKDIPLQQQFWSFVTVLWFCKIKIQETAKMLVLVIVLWVTISKVYWQFWHSFFKYTF